MKRPYQESPPVNEVLIQPSRGWASLNLREFWSYRELLYFLALRDVRLRYKQTALGILWVAIQPLATMLLFWFLFGKLAGIKSDGIPYPFFAYTALLLWNFFSKAVTNSSDSLVGSAHLIGKIYFPRMIIPIAAVGPALMDLIISLPLLAILVFYYGVSLNWTILMVPVLVLLNVVLAVAVGMWISALNVKYRDVRYALPFLLQLWMFASPIIYPLSMLPQEWRWVLRLNPLTAIIEALRSALSGRKLDWGSLAISAGMTLALLIYSSYAFRRAEKSFADII